MRQQGTLSSRLKNGFIPESIWDGPRNFLLCKMNPEWAENRLFNEKKLSLNIPLIRFSGTFTARILLTSCAWEFHRS